MLRVGLIGFGAIGRQVAQGIVAGHGGEVELCAILRRTSRNSMRAEARHTVPARALSMDSSPPDSVEVTSVAPMLTDFGDFSAHRPDVVLEAASAAAVAAYAEPILATGASLIVASSSALVDGALRSRLEAACRRGDARVYVPACALAGLDALTAAAVAGLDVAALRVVEPGPTSRRLFGGSAVAAAMTYPDRLNIAAAAALAVGPGAEVTVSLEQADAHGRTIELSAQGPFGSFSARLEPRVGTDEFSHIVALSLLAALRRLQQPLWIG